MKVSQIQYNELILSLELRKMKNKFTLSFVLCLTLHTFSQKNVFLDIAPMFQNSNLEMNQNYTAWNGKIFALDHFDYYLSNIQIEHDGGQLTAINSVFLIEPQNHTLYLGNFNIVQIEKISFLVGVPKPLNTQTGDQAMDISLYPENHPLSFQSPSMYWGWQFGYMHMIIGGNADHNGDGSLESQFELHNLGNTNQQLIQMNNVIQSNVSQDQINVNINCQVDQWINNISISTVGILHGETGVNAQIMGNALSENVFIQPANAGVDINSDNSKIYFQNNNNTLDIYWKDLTQLNKIHVYDLGGKLMGEYLTNQNSGQLAITHLNKGYYLIQFLTKNALVIGSLNAIQ
ncbi:MAG: hypothetical protein FJY17_08305 [Bacteroidetes bacterium]|nr:hypothetical protein [Bacteroidota bacterium]MBM3418902.1 hypothetical protein [Bacteroidota bacterium]